MKGRYKMLRRNKKVIALLQDLVKEFYGSDFMVTYSDTIASIVLDSKRVLESIEGFQARDYGEISFFPCQLVDFTSFVAKQVAHSIGANMFDMRNLEKA